MAEGNTLANWYQNELSELLGFPVGKDMVNYVLAFESAREIREYFTEILGLDAESKFVDEFFKRWAPPNTIQVYRKQDEFQDLIKPKQQKKKKNQKGNAKVIDNLQTSVEHIANKELSNPTSNQTETTFDLPTKMTVDVVGAEFLDKNKPMDGEINLTKSCSPFKKKNLKFVPLFSADGKLKTDTVTLPGRHPCQCLAQKHKLINNCSACGRIVCEQEGSGPCMFCNNLVCSPEMQEIIARDSNKGKKLKEKLQNQYVPDDAVIKDDVNEGLQKALDHKNRLLQYDKNFSGKWKLGAVEGQQSNQRFIGKRSTKRTKVIDDESDYFASDNRWLSKKQRDAVTKREQELRDKRFASRLDKKFTIDFAGRKIYENEEENNMYVEEDISTPIESLRRTEELTDVDMSERFPLIDPRVGTQLLTFNPDVVSKENTPPDRSTQETKNNNHNKRVQDNELQEIVDQGMCMSMHQPWASLLVHGIKRLEGRSWYTPHRGRLWIAATSQKTEKEVIESVVEDFKHMYPEIPHWKYPKEYPSAALLGCVNVVDCASNEDYFDKNPDCQEENNSAYLFVCENPQQLKIKFQMSGKHKIYKLESHVHAAARKNLQYLS